MIKKYNLIAMIFGLAIFAAEKYFFIFLNPDWRIIYLILCAIIFIFFHQSHRSHSSFNTFITFFVLMLCISFANVTFNNYLPFRIASRNYIFLLMILLYYPISFIIERYGEEILISAIIKMSVLLALTLLLQSIFRNIHLIQYGLSERNDQIRTVQGNMLILFGTLLGVDRLSLKFKKTNILNWLLVILNIYALINIYQSRSAIFAFIIASLFLITSKSSVWIRKNFNSFFKWIFFISAGLIILFYALTNANEILNTSIQNRESSSINRIAAYQYYWDLFLDHPFLGIGLTEGDLNKLSREGVNNLLYTHDIGFVGYIAQFGSMGLTSLIILVVSYYKKAKQSKHPIFMSFGILLITISPFNMLLNIDTYIIYLVFLLALLDKTKKLKPSSCYKKRFVLS